MGFWEDSSPLVKGALAIGVVGLLYLGIAFGIGFFPFAPGCTHTVDGEEVSGFDEGSDCSDDGQCIQNQRGIGR